MGDGNRMTIEGEPTKRFRVWWMGENDMPYKCEGEYDTVEELNEHKWRLDRHYKIEFGRKYITRREFSEWAKMNSSAGK